MLSQYNQIPYLPCGQPTNWRTVISQKFSHTIESSEPYVRVPSEGSSIRRRSPQSIWLWKPAGLECRSSIGLGETETPLLEGAHKVSHELGPRAKQWIHRSLGHTYLQVLEDLLGRFSCGSLWGQGHWWWTPGNTHWCELSQRSPFWHRELAPPTAFRLQCWDSSGHTTNKVGTQAYPSADRLPKVILSQPLPLNRPLNMALPTRGTRPSPTDQWAGTSPSHKEACTSPWINLTQHGADTRTRKNYSLPAWGTETTNRKVDKMRWQRNMFQMEEQDKTPEEQLNEDR